MTEADTFFLPSLLTDQTPVVNWMSPNLVIGVTGFNHGAGSSTVTNQIAETLGAPCVQDAGQPRRVQAVKWWQEAHPADPLPDPYSEGVLDAYETHLHEPGNYLLLQQVNIETDRSILATAAMGNCVISGKASVALLNTDFLAEVCDGTPPPVHTTLLTCDPPIAAERALQRDVERRILSAQALEANHQQLLAQKMQLLGARMEQNRADWKAIYGLDVDHLGQYYNLTVDASNITPQQVTAVILQSLGLFVDY